jgi:hypothetical protein
MAIHTCWERHSQNQYRGQILALKPDTFTPAYGSQKKLNKIQNTSYG